MIVIGAKGFAKEILEIIKETTELVEVAFYDDIDENSPKYLYELFPILKNDLEVIEHFKRFGPKFTAGIGNPYLRKRMCDKFESLGGVLTSTISRFADIGSYDITIGNGSNILSGAILSNSVKVGILNIIYYNVIITHDVTIGNYVELSPGVRLLGRSSVGDFSTVGCNAVILPDIKVGKNVTIGAGAVVTKSLPDNCVAVGIPAKIIKFKNE